MPTTDGILLVDKPAGVTSHDVVAAVRKAAHERRVGHAGTLDPFATGLLVLLLGHGTRLLDYIDGEPKVYVAGIRFGAETDTDDATGTIVREADPPSRAGIADAIAKLTGSLAQVPPDYSAKHVAGARAYAAARRGAPIELAPAQVTVHSWEIERCTGDSLEAVIVCSGGTYIRALARDLGRMTGSAAHLAALRRLRSGPFSVDAAEGLDRIRAGELNVLPLRAAIPSMPTQVLDESSLGRVRHGNPVAAATGGGEGDRVALVDQAGDVVAIASRAGGSLQPRVVFRDA